MIVVSLVIFPEIEIDSLLKDRIRAENQLKDARTSVELVESKAKEKVN